MRGKVTCFSLALVPRFFITLNSVTPRGSKTQALEPLRPRSLTGNTVELRATPWSVKTTKTFPAELFTFVSRPSPSLVAPLVGLSPLYTSAVCVVWTYLRLWGQSSQDTRLKKESNPQLIL